MAEELVTTPSSFSISEFRKSIDGMIATNEKAYQPVLMANATHRTKIYTEDEVRHIIESGTAAQKAELSLAFYRTNGMYRRIILYYATMLKFQGILVPSQVGGKKITQEVGKRYYNALDFLEKIDVPLLGVHFTRRALINGCYYGIVQSLSDDGISIIDLPHKYCISRYKDAAGNDLIEFNVSYFDTLREDQRKIAFNVFPVEFRKAYLKYKHDREFLWYKIPASIGICLPFFDGDPLFLTNILKLINYDDYQNLEKEKDKDEVRKILVQQIPHLNDGTLLFQPIEAEEIHRGAVNMMSKNKNVSVLTTYADVEIQNSNNADSAKFNNLDKISQTIYRDAGVSSEIFAATGNMALSISIENDLALLMDFANKISRFITNMINRVYGNQTTYFKYEILPISYYNDTDYLNNAQKLATSGYSFILPALALGISQKDIVNLKDLENDVLKMDKRLIPLASTFGQNGQAKSGTGEGAGRPALDDTKKSDKTIANERAADNAGGSE